MIGRKLAHYEILARLGKGGMGDVYRARDTKLGRDVALKILRPDMAGSAEQIERFQREARAVAALQHPHIVTLFSVEEHERIRFITMELVVGRNLGDFIRPGGLPFHRVFDVGIALADAIATAHDHGVVHRDLKPSNVMIAEDGSVKVLDFGLAKLCETPGIEPADTTRTFDLTRAGATVGTLPYMSPEQLTGGPVDPRTDVFSLGVLLYELTAGRRPFQRDSGPEVGAAILAADPAPLDRIRADTPPDLSRIVRRCLAKAPDRRIQTARDVRNELEDARAHPTSPARGVAASSGAGAVVSARRFNLTTAHVRRLETRLTSMIGDSMTLIDNERDSEVLVFCLHGIGADHTDFEELVRVSPFRTVAASQYGFGPDAPLRPELPLSDHNRLVVAVLEHLRGEIAPRHLVVVGHSSGCDQLLRILGSERPDGLRSDGFLALGPSFRPGPGLVTGPYSQLTDDPDDILGAIKAVSSTVPDLDEWIAAHEYLIRAFRKFRYDVAPLRRFAIDIIDGRARDAVIADFRVVCERVSAIRCVFAKDDAPERDYALKLHLRDDALGPGFDETMFVDATVGHMELRRGDVVVPQLESLIRGLGSG